MASGALEGAVPASSGGDQPVLDLPSGPSRSSQSTSMAISVCEQKSASTQPVSRLLAVPLPQTSSGPRRQGTPAHAFTAMLDPKSGLASGDPQRMAARIIESVDAEPSPLRMVLGAQALASTLDVLRARIAASRPIADFRVRYRVDRVVLFALAACWPDWRFRVRCHGRTPCRRVSAASRP